MLKVNKVTKKKNKFDFNDLHFEIGIKKKKVNFSPKSNKYSKVDGKKTRSINKEQRNKETNVDILKKLESRYKLLSKPKNNKFKQLNDRVANYICDFLVTGRNLNKALDTALLIVRKPILEGKYKNKKTTAKIKGFNRGGMDTGQTYASIQAILIKDNKEFK